LMARLLRQPFSCDIEGRAVQITESDCAMMLRSSIIEELTNTVLVDNRKRKEDNDDGGNITKKRRTGGHATVNTVMGADGVTALEQTSRRDKTLKFKEREAKMKSLAKEIVELEKVKGDIQKRMWKFPDNNSVGGGNTQETTEQQENEKEEIGEDAQEIMVIVATKKTTPSARNQKNKQTTTDERYWEVHETSDKEHCKLFLRMFVPGSGVLSKSQNEQWNVIRDKVLPTLTQLSFDAQHEKIGRRLVQAEIDLNALKEMDVPEDMEDGTADVDEDGDDPEP
jgi:hypothetical protein